MGLAWTVGSSFTSMSLFWATCRTFSAASVRECMGCTSSQQKSPMTEMLVGRFPAGSSERFMGEHRCVPVGHPVEVAGVDDLEPIPGPDFTAADATDEDHPIRVHGFRVDGVGHLELPAQGGVLGENRRGGGRNQEHGKLLEHGLKLSTQPS